MLRYFSILFFVIFGTTNITLASGLCHSIDDKAYVNLYKLRLKYSDFHIKTESFIKNFINKNCDANNYYSFLSVGPGNGDLEKELLDSKKNIKSLDFIEPNEGYVTALSKKFSSSNKVKIIKNYYNADSLSQKYDFILMNQVVHLFKNPIREIIQSINQLNSGGQLIIVLHSEHGLQYFRKKFAAQYSNVVMPHYITGEDISYALKNHNIAHKVDMIDTSLNIAPCFSNTTECQDLISFIFLYNFKQCKELHITDQIQNNFLQLAIDHPKRLLEPMVVISIKK